MREPHWAAQLPDLLSSLNSNDAVKSAVTHSDQIEVIFHPLEQ